MSLYSQVESRDLWGYYILCGILFFLYPILGIFIASLFAIKTESRQVLLLLIVFLVLYLSALNSTKVPVSDMRNYLRMFNAVPSSGYSDTLLYYARGGGAAKDMGYSTLVYILYYLTFGNQNAFIIIVSSITFSFYFIAIYKFCVKYELPIYLIVSELLVIAFFTQYFTLTFHLVRQELATSIFFYALTFRSSSIKKYIIWSVVASTMHSAIVAIVIFSIIPYMNQELTKKRIVILVGIALSFIFIVSNVGVFLLDNIELEGSFEYSVSRMAEAEGASDGLNKSSGTIYIYSALMTFLSIIEILKNKGNVTYPLIVNLCFVWGVLVLGLYGSPLLQYRFYFMEHNFLPFVVFLLFRHNSIILKMVCFCTVLFFIVRFYVSLNNVFQYVPSEEALTEPFFGLINM